MRPYGRILVDVPAFSTSDSARHVPDMTTGLYVPEGQVPPVGWLLDGLCMNRARRRTDGEWVRRNGRGMPLPYR